MMEIVIDLIQLQVRNMVGKYSKIALAKLEESGKLTPDIRKIVLDSFNDQYRDIERRLTDIKLRHRNG